MKKITLISIIICVLAAWLLSGCGIKDSDKTSIVDELIDKGIDKLAEEVDKKINEQSDQTEIPQEDPQPDTPQDNSNASLPAVDHGRMIKWKSLNGYREQYESGLVPEIDNHVQNAVDGLTDYFSDQTGIEAVRDQVYAYTICTVKSYYTDRSREAYYKDTGEICTKVPDVTRCVVCLDGGATIEYVQKNQRDCIEPGIAVIGYNGTYVNYGDVNRPQLYNGKPMWFRHL